MLASLVNNCLISSQNKEGQCLRESIKMRRGISKRSSFPAKSVQKDHPITASDGFLPENKNVTAIANLRRIREKVKTGEAEFQKCQESLYADAVSNSLQFYEDTFKALFDSTGFLSLETVKSEHARLKQEILQEIDFQPATLVNTESLETHLEKKFKDIEKENSIKKRDVEAGAKFSIFKCKNKYLSSLRVDIDILENKIADATRKMLEDTCPARGNQAFADAQKSELETWIQNIQAKINGHIEELVKEVAKEGRAGI